MTLGICVTYLVAQSNTKTENNETHSMAVSGGAATGPGLVVWFFMVKIGLKKGRKTQCPIDPRGRRADPRRMGHGAKQGLRAAGCQESEVLMVPRVVREDWMQHGPSWHEVENMPWVKVQRMRANCVWR